MAVFGTPAKDASLNPKAIENTGLTRLMEIKKGIVKIKKFW